MAVNVALRLFDLGWGWELLFGISLRE